MPRMFDRWFNKSAKIDEADLIISRSIEGLKLQAEAHQASWGFGNLDRWDVDLKTGVIRFSSSDGFDATAMVQVVGTYNTLDNTFLWAWDHPSIPDERATASCLAREFGEKYALIDYSSRKVECDEETAWEYAAVTNHLADMQGVYRGPSGSTYIFLVFSEVTLSKRTEQ
jgi:hypothetical protein